MTSVDPTSTFYEYKTKKNLISLMKKKSKHYISLRFIGRFKKLAVGLQL